MALLGKNGAGKSTILKIITGVVYSTSGEVNVKGSIWTATSKKEIKKGASIKVLKIEGVKLLVEEKKEDTEMVESVVMGIGGVDKEVKRILKDGENYVRLRDLEGVLSVSYDRESKKVSVYKK